MHDNLLIKPRQQPERVKVSNLWRQPYHARFAKTNGEVVKEHIVYDHHVVAVEAVSRNTINPIGLRNVDWRSSVTPLFWLSLGMLFAAGYLIKIVYQPDPYYDTPFGSATQADTIFAIIVGLAAWICICLRHMKFKVGIRIGGGELYCEHDYPEDGNTKGMSVQTEQQWLDAVEAIPGAKAPYWYNARNNGEFTLPFIVTMGGVARLQEDVRYQSDEIYRDSQIRKGEIGSLVSGFTNYNPAEVAIVKVDTVFWRYLIGFIAICAVFLSVPVAIIAAIDFTIGKEGLGLLGPAGETVLKVPIALGLMGALLFVFWWGFRAIGFVLLNIPIVSRSQSLENYRLRVRSRDGKWSTLLETKSETIATEAYNLVSREVREIGE